MSGERPLQVLIVGRGRVGRAIHSALSSSKDVRSRLVSGRAPSRTLGVPSLVILTVPDAAVADVAVAISARLSHSFAIAHSAGALAAEALAGARSKRVQVAQMHPLLSFIHREPPSFQGATMLVDGDRSAVVKARRVARALGMKPRSFPQLSRVDYHAAAALLAGGASALTFGAQALLGQGGVPPQVALEMLLPLLRSVVDNLERVGLPEALSGPVRRGNEAVVARHLAAGNTASRSVGTWLSTLQRAAIGAQLELARELEEAPRGALEKIRRQARAGSSAKEG